MTLRQAAARHAQRVTTRLDHFGERVVRQRAGTASLAVNVTIHRFGNSQLEEAARVGFFRAHVFVPAGRDVKKGDELVFAMEIGGESTANRVDTLVRSDVDGNLWEVIR